MVSTFGVPDMRPTPWAVIPDVGSGPPLAAAGWNLWTSGAAAGLWLPLQADRTTAARAARARIGVVFLIVSLDAPRTAYGSRLMKALRSFTVRTELPPALAPLQELATNLRWSW